MKTAKQQTISNISQTPCLLPNQIPNLSKYLDLTTISLTFPIIQNINDTIIISLALYGQDNQIIQHNSLDNFNLYLKPNKLILKTLIKTVQISKTGKKYSGKADTTIDQGKNIGKKSETTILQQVIIESLKKYNKHIQSKNQQYPHFMLLDLYKYENSQKKSNNILQFPVFIQRKYDGLRCGAIHNSTKIVLISRGLKEYTALTYINTQFQLLFDYINNTGLLQIIQQIIQIPNFNFTSSTLIDGELYIHNTPLQILNSLIRNSTNSQESNIQFIIYDLDFTQHNHHIQLKNSNPFFDQTINNRLSQIPISFEKKLEILTLLRDIIKKKEFKNIQIAETIKVSNDKELQQLFTQFVSEKYEGAVIRFPSSIYCYSYNSRRSKDTLKYKLKLDMEVQVINYHQGNGKDQQSIIFECIIPNLTKSFYVVQNISLDKRKALFALLQSQPQLFEILKKIPLNIEYSSISQQGIPQQPRAIYFRTELNNSFDSSLEQILPLIQ